MPTAHDKSKTNKSLVDVVFIDDRSVESSGSLSELFTKSCIERRTLSEHNQRVYDMMRPGDMIRIKRSDIYSHWAIAGEHGELIHVTAPHDYAPVGGSYSGSKSCCYSAGDLWSKAVICAERFWDVVGQSPAYIDNYLDPKKRPLPRREILRRAYDRIGEKGYNLVWQNCEHFATWCRYGSKSSRQTEQGGVTLGASVAAVLCSLFACVFPFFIIDYNSTV